jgi:hypothetical protein
MNGREVKQVLSGDGYQWEGGEHKERVKEGEYGASIIFMYENRIMKPAEIFLRERRMERVNLIKIYCKHICKCITIIY